jgi:alpha-tubulin suppressor-like RCC1 family protein/type II secretory pathway pseudopilin PulG
MRGFAHRRARGFSLLELTVILVILGVIIGLAVPSYVQMRENSKVAVALATARAVMSNATALITQARATTVSDHVVAISVSELTRDELVLLGSAGDGTSFAFRHSNGISVCATVNPDRYTEVSLARIYPEQSCGTVRVPGDDDEMLLLTGSGGDSEITLSFTPANQIPYTARCWSAPMGQANALSLLTTASPVTITGAENYVTHACQVTDATGKQSNTVYVTPVAATATPAADDPLPPTPPGQPASVVVEDDELPNPNSPSQPDGSSCGAGCTVTTVDPAGSITDVSSFYSTHTGAHQLFFVHRSTGSVGYVYDANFRYSRYGQLSFRDATNTGVVAFSDPSALAYGAHPSRRPNSNVTLFSVLYLTDAATGRVWMLDVKASRAHLVADGLDSPTGVTWAACRDTATGAMTTVAGTAQCLYVATATGIVRVPLSTTTDAFGSLQPQLVGTAGQTPLSAAVATKLVAFDTLVTGEAAQVALRDYTGSVTTSAAAASAGVAFIKAAVTGTTDMVVATDGNRIVRFNPANPGTVIIVAGTAAAGYVDGVGTAARFAGPQAVHFHGNWPFAYVADTANNALRRVNVVTGEVVTVLGPTTTNALLGWGNNGVAYGVTFDDHVIAQPDITVDYPTPMPIYGALTGRNVTAISIGYSTGCAVADGTPYCWSGNNAWGNLGTGNATASSTPITPVLTGVLAGRTVTKIASDSYAHVCALLDNGTVSCWGYRNVGQVGNGSSSGVSGITSPVLVTVSGSTPLTGATDVAVGYEHSCAVANGLAYCWGRATDGRLGDGQSSTNRTRPVAVSTAGVLAGKTITAIGTGTSFSCALDADGAAYCWGLGSGGRLGNGTTTTSNVPVAVTMPSGVRFTSLAVGGEHTCAIGDDQRAYCWGRSQNGRLGDGQQANDRLTPVLVYTSAESASSELPAGVPVTFVAAGSSSSCAIAGGVAYCWGNAANGALGVAGASGTVLVPKAVTTSTAVGLRRAVMIAITELGASTLGVYAN